MLNLTVTGFNLDSPAEKVGMQVGDRLIDVRPTEETAGQFEDIPTDPVSFKDRESVLELTTKARILDDEGTAENVANWLTPQPGTSVPAMDVQAYLPMTMSFLVRVQRGEQIIELQMPAANTILKPAKLDWPEGSLSF